MLNNLVARFIGPFLSQYCKEINSNQIEIELRNGRAQLKDLVFQEDCFIHHHIPFYVKRGLINSLSLSISSDQCNVFIENLILVGSEVFGSTLITDNQFVDTFSEKTFLKQILKSILGIFFDPSFDNLKKLFDNLTISIQKIHIRIEGLMNNKSLGVMCGSINFYSVDDSNQKIVVTKHPATFSKKIDVKNFSIYFDTENKYPINKYSDSFESQMIMQIVNENEFVLDPISFDCVFKYNTEFNSISDFKSSLGDLKLSFNNLQYEAFQNLINDIKIQRFYNFLDRPFKSIKSERSSTLWWCYSYRCVRYKKTSFQQLNIPLALDVLKKRKKFYGLWKDYVVNSDRYAKDYNEFKNTLNPNTLVLLRYYSSFLFSKNTNNRSQLFTEEDIVRYFGKTKEMIPSEFNFSIDSLQFDLNLNIKNEKENEINETNSNKEEENNSNNNETGSDGLNKVEYSVTPLSGLTIENILIKISKTKDDINLNIETKSIYLNNYLNEKYRDVLQIPDGVNGFINLNKIDSNQRIKLDVQSISAVFDANFFSLFYKYFSNANFVHNKNKISIKSKNAKYLIESHIKTKLDLQIGNTNIIIPYQEIEVDTPVIQISLDLIEIHSALQSRYNINLVESLYDKYELSFNSIQVLLNNQMLVNKFDLKSNINVPIINFEEIDPVIINNFISPLEVNLTAFNSILLTEILLYLSDEFTVNSDVDHVLDLMIPEFKVSFSIQSTSIIFSYRDDIPKLDNTEAFKILMKDQTEINVFRKDQTIHFSLLNNSGIEGYEYFNSDNGNFLFSEKFEFKIEFLPTTNNVTIDFGNIEIYAKSIPVHFIQVFAESPKHFEWNLHLKKEPTIQKFLHKKKQLNKKWNGFDMNLKFGKTIIYFIEYEAKCKEEKEMFTLIINHILVFVQHNPIRTVAKIESDPPLATTSQFGNIWKNMISDNERSLHPIIVNITPTHLAIDLDYFQVSISPILLLKIIKFSLAEKNPYSHLPGDPATSKYLTFDLHVEKVLVKIIYDIEVYNYYELTITHSQYVTLKAPFLHQIALDSLQIVQKLQNKEDNLLFKLQNVTAELDMTYLLRNDVDNYNVESFISIVQKKGLQNWKDETVKYLDSIGPNEKILQNVFFYFYKLCFNCKLDYFYCLYSHDFARNISYLLSKLLMIIKNDKFVDFLKEIDEPLDFSIAISMKKGEFSLVNQTDVNIAKLILDTAVVQVNPDPFLFNAKLNSINLIDDQDYKILETRDLSVKTIENELYIILESFNLNLKLSYLPDSIYYIMNCPLFSFVDEFNNQKELTPTSFEMTKKIYFSLNCFKATFPVNSNIFLLGASFDVSLTPKGNIVQIRDIQMYLNQRIMMKQFSILFSNDVWDVEPISIYFSVFELHIIKMLIEEIKDLTMPPIFISKKEAELKRREFIIKLQTIDLVLTQPNLPFLILEIKPSTFKQSYSDTNGGQQIIDYNVEMLLKHENHSNYGIDTIIDPFVISVNSKTINLQKLTYAHISPINIAISPYILSEILQIKKRYSARKLSSQIFQDKIIFFRNDTGVPIDLYLYNKETKEEAKFEINDNNPFQIDLKWSPDVKVCFLYKTVLFSIKDLCYPMFFDRIVLVYLVADFGIQTIHFSSPYIIKNKLSYDIEVFINDYNIGVIKSKSEKPVPLVLVTSISNGIKAAISPIKTTPSPAVRFKKPNSEAKLYKFIDEQNNRNLYSSIYFSTDSQRSICYISFLPYALYMNQLPVPVSLTLLNEYNLNYRIGTSQYADVSFLKDKKSKLKIKVAIDPFGESEPTEVHTFSKQSKPSRIIIKQSNEVKCKIAVMTEFSKKTNTYRIYIFAPCILYNKTGASLTIKDSKDVFYPFIDNLCFYTPDEYPKKVPLRILIKDVTKINKVDINCLNTKSVETFSLPFINNDKIFLFLSATKILIPFESTTQLSIMVQFMVFNHLNKSVFLIPSNIGEAKQFTNHCKHNTKVPIVFTNLEGKFNFIIEGYEKCKDVNLLNQTTTVFRLLSKDENVPDFLIQLDVIKEENGFCGHLSYPTFPSPTAITNMLTDQSISVFQKSSSNKKHPMIVNSMTTSLFAKPQPFIEQESKDVNSVVINIDTKSIEFTVSFTSDISPQRIEKTNYYYEVRTTNSGDKMIIIGELNEQNLSSLLNQSISKEVKELINVHLTKIEISFIDNYMHELFLLVIKNIIFKYKKHKSLKISVDSLHVNDMCIASKSPVVICEKELKFLTIKLKSRLPFSMHSIENLDIKIAPIHIFIDIKFVLDICFTINEFLEHFKIDIETKKEVDENKLKRFSFYSIKHLLISPLHIEFTLVKSKGRLNRVPYPKKKNFILLCLIKNIFVIPFETYKEFTAIEIQNIRAPIHNFIKSLALMYLNQISTADIYNLIFRDSSLFNLSSTESFIDFIEDSFNDSHQNKIVNTIAKPERIPRAFPLNRIISVSSTFNNDTRSNNYCRYSLAQFTFQKTHPYESLLVLVDSKNDDNNNGDNILAIFNHYIVILSSNFQEVKLIIKIPEFLLVDNQGNKLVIVIKNNQEINFFCKDDHEARLIVTIVRSIAYRMSLFCESSC